MRILFVKPNMGLVDGQPYYDRGRMEPLTFAALAGATPPEHHVALCDDRFEPVPYHERWDLVAINTEIYTARRSYEIADRFRAMHVPVALGGYHTTLAPEEAAAHADAIAIGDAERVWPSLVADASAGKLQPRYEQGLRPEERGFDLRLDWSIFEHKDYLPVRLAQFSRGCPNGCEYCATGNIYGGVYAHRPVEQVVSELEADGHSYVFFVDDNIIADIPAARQLFQRLIPLRIRWIGQASLNFANDPALMDLMLDSGCSGLVVGFESLDDRNLGAMNKRVNLGQGAYRQVVANIRRSGLMTWAAFLLGYDHETVSSIRETVDWALEQKFAFSAFNILMPYPNTPFYSRMQAEDRLLYDGRWWLHDDYRFGYAGFRPKQISPEQLAEEGLRARLLHASARQILRRAWQPQTNSKDLWSALTYFAYNPLFRDEMKKKHGMVLGYRGFERPRTEGSAWRRLVRDDLGGLVLGGLRRAFERLARRVA